MNLADQAAHAIVIAARKMNVDPISVLLRNVEPTPEKVYARNLAAALMSRLPEWDGRKALDAFGVSTNEDYLENFISRILAGQVRLIQADEFDRLLQELMWEVLDPPSVTMRAEMETATQAYDRIASERPPITGLLDILYGIEDVTR